MHPSGWRRRLTPALGRGCPPAMCAAFRAGKHRATWLWLQIGRGLWGAQPHRYLLSALGPVRGKTPIGLPVGESVHRLFPGRTDAWYMPQSAPPNPGEFFY